MSSRIELADFCFENRGRAIVTIALLGQSFSGSRESSTRASIAVESAHDNKGSGNELDAAVERLAARYRPALIAYFRRRAPVKADAEDLAQEVFVRVLKRGGLDEVENAEAFLFHAAANLVRDQGRRTLVRRQHAAEEFATAVKAEVLSPERVYEGREQLTTLMSALDELTEKTRDMFLLHRLERMKYHEIADLYGVSLSAVEKHIMKALAHVTRRMGKP